MSRQSHKAGHELFIVNHKTRHPMLGPKHDLHAAAKEFLAACGLVGDGASQIDPARVFFELTPQDKVARAATLACEVFIDDLPEILAMPGFPKACAAFCLIPKTGLRIPATTAVPSWAGITADLVGMDLTSE